MNDVFITGASSGIGRQLALQLAARGCRIGMYALPGDELTGAADEVSAAGAEVVAFGGDVRDRDRLRGAVEEFARTGGLDIFIGCAGVDIDIPIDRFDSERVEFLYDVNLKGLMYGVNAALEFMLAQGKGHIVGFSSLAGWRIFPIHADYGATKSAVFAYLESLRVRLRSRGIAITTVSPGQVQTPMTAGTPYPMPFSLMPDEAARIILRGIDRRKNHIVFPAPMAGATSLLRALPEPLWNFLLRFVKVKAE